MLHAVQLSIQDIYLIRMAALYIGAIGNMILLGFVEGKLQR